MSLVGRVKEKFHNDKHNKNRMMYTISNQQKFGMDGDDSPRNRMMDTVSNEQGAVSIGAKKNSALNYDAEVVNKNLMTHTISNQQAEYLASGINIHKDRSAPRNKLLDIKPNQVLHSAHYEYDTNPKLNSNRVL